MVAMLSALSTFGRLTVTYAIEFFFSSSMFSKFIISLCLNCQCHPERSNCFRKAEAVVRSKDPFLLALLPSHKGVLSRSTVRTPFGNRHCAARNPSTAYELHFEKFVLRLG